MPLHFVQIEHIVKCLIVNLPKLSSMLKRPYTQTNEYNLENTCLEHNANLKWKLNVMKFTGYELSLIYGNSEVEWSPFHVPF